MILKFRKVLPVLLLPLLSAALLPSCRVLDPRGPAIGRDYFNPDFQCVTQEIAEEQNEKFREAYDLYRKAIFKPVPPLKRGERLFIITGDSTSALFLPSYLQNRLHSYRVVNRGIPGDTTPLLLQRLPEDLISLKPDLIMVVIGGNDILGGRCLDIALSNTAEIIETLGEKLPKTRILLTGVPPVITWKANTITPFYNYKLQKLADLYPRVTYLDLWSFLSYPDRPVLKEEYYLYHPKKKLDPIHINETGYRAWAGELAKLIPRLR